MLAIGDMPGSSSTRGEPSLWDHSSRRALLGKSEKCGDLCVCTQVQLFFLSQFAVSSSEEHSPAHLRSQKHTGLYSCILAGILARVLWGSSEKAADIAFFTTSSRLHVVVILITSVGDLGCAIPGFRLRAPFLLERLVNVD